MIENIYFHFMHTHVLFIFSLILFSLNSFGHQLVAAVGEAANTCINNERQALLDFKAHLQDPHDVLSTWRPEEEDDCCQWHGVKCNNQTGHVTELDLSGFIEIGLGGEISLSLLNLTYLNYLDLNFNSLRGTIPNFICSMTHLTYLDLGSNEFTSTIPESIGSLTKLTYLNLRGNHFSGTIPMSIGNMTNLTYLDLSRNEFVGTVPRFIGSLTKLTNLGLGGNDFTGTIPEFIGNMTNLTYLELSENDFSGTITRSIGSLTKLKYLDLSHNSFYGTIPTEFGNLTNLLQLHLSSLGSCTIENLDWLSPLSYLDDLTLAEISLVKADYWVNVIIGLQNLLSLSLDGCNLSQVKHPYSSPVNSSLNLLSLSLENNNLSSLEYHWLFPLIGHTLESLSLSGNTFDGNLPDFLKTLSGYTWSTLQYLGVSRNQFTGSLSDEIQKFSSLTRLYLSSNQLNGTISDKLWELGLLEELDLSSNFLRGSISKVIGKSNLFHIDLSNNPLEGVPFNADMSNLLTHLEYLDFSSCKLGPRFPEWIKKMKNLLHLDLSNNSISDTISAEYWIQWQPSQLRYLNLSFNNISGTLPELLSYPDLNSVDLSFNNFYGPIPSFPLGKSFVNLSRNRFHGRISFLCQMYEGLEFLDLSWNSLAGQLPDCFRNLTKLTFLNLGHNFLSGRFPPSMIYLDQLEMFSLYNNSFSGEFPLSLRNCTKLSFLDFGANKFTGNVPVWIGENLPQLYFLSLRSNNFFGTIPWQLCQLVSLQILDLSINNLHGTIPSCVNNLTTMIQKGLFVKQNIHHYTWIVDAVSDNYGYYFHDEFNNSKVDNAMLEWQGKVNEFSSNLRLVKTIDLSSNNLTGQIPNEVTNLHGLLVLDLSNNNLVGEIPQSIGQMTELLTLNLSRNMLSGKIPSSMSQMDLLNDLDVSYNNLSERIPSGTQLQTFEPARYIGNAGLCGSPLPKKCPGDEELDESHTIGKSQGDEEGIERWFYIGGASGFATGFWIVCSTLLLNRRWRHAFFQLHDSLKDWVYVKVGVCITKWRRVARA